MGQLTYLRPYVTDFTPEWLAGSTLALVAGAMSLVYIADTISELKLGNGTSVLIFAGIASSLPASVGALLAQNASDDPGNVAVYAAAFFLTTLGIIYVQEAERRIPVNYSGRYRAGALAQQSYLPFKVNATGVMPLIFASSLLGLPLALARYTDSTALDGVANALGPGGALYLPASVALIAFFNYYYTFLQVEGGREEGGEEGRRAPHARLRPGGGVRCSCGHRGRRQGDSFLVRCAQPHVGLRPSRHRAPFLPVPPSPHPRPPPPTPTPPARAQGPE